MTPKELFHEGKLTEAIATVSDGVKRRPADVSQRGLLCELLCFAGELERADRQLDAIGQQEPEAMLGVAMFRHLIRAEQARQQFYGEGRLPELLGLPSPQLKLHLEASILLREGKTVEAAVLLEKAEAARPALAGTCDGKPFDDLRDLDDLTSSFFEVLTSTGKYYWIPMEQVERIEWHPPERPRDLLWRRASMTVSGGPDGEVFMPALYAGSHGHADDLIRLGRSTDWGDERTAPMRGVGQRMFLFGDEARAILELSEITFNLPADADHGETAS